MGDDFAREELQRAHTQIDLLEKDKAALTARVGEQERQLNAVDAVISRDKKPEAAFNEIVKLRVEALRQKALAARKGAP